MPPVPPACESGGGHVPPQVLWWRRPCLHPSYNWMKIRKRRMSQVEAHGLDGGCDSSHMSKPTCVRQRPDRVVALRLVSVSKGRLQLFSAAHNLSLSCCVARMRCKSARYWLTAAPIATPHRQQMDVASAICFVSDVCRR